mmetsp:Transcript_7893/g.25872  ORF Transcript_7893/g.25872 Transcript_7893/m.25872 type:complete len:236 (+) Transcript_7893:75-782(+)
MHPQSRFCQLPAPPSQSRRNKEIGGNDRISSPPIAIRHVFIQVRFYWCASRLPPMCLDVLAGKRDDRSAGLPDRECSVPPSKAAYICRFLVVPVRLASRQPHGAGEPPGAQCGWDGHLPPLRAPPQPYLHLLRIALRDESGIRGLAASQPSGCTNRGTRHRQPMSNRAQCARCGRGHAVWRATNHNLRECGPRACVERGQRLREASRGQRASGCVVPRRDLAVRRSGEGSADVLR